MSSETEIATEEFINALVDVLQASRNGRASIDLRSRLAKARTKAEKLLTTTQYSGAVFKAFRIGGIGVE